MSAHSNGGVPPGTPKGPRVTLPKDPNACWKWNKHISRLGDAYLTFLGKNTIARRWMWEQLFGMIPDACQVYTTCGNKSCVNPYHLKCGTAADRVAISAQATLTPLDIVEIRKAKVGRTRSTASLLAARYGVHSQTIRDIWNGRTWNRNKRKPATQRKLEAEAPHE